MIHAITTKGLTKQYGKTTVVNQIDWNVGRGSLHALLGPNGAGKTTTLKMLLDICRPTSGSAEVLALHSSSQSVQIRSRTVFLPEDKILYQGMNGRNFLSYFASFYPAWSNETALALEKRWQLALDRDTERLSKGERARLLWTAALASNTDLIIADEPTEGMDPAAIEELFVQLTQAIAGGDKTMVMATHRLEEAERICDSISIVDHGRLLLSGNLDDLRASWKIIDVSGRLSHETVKSWQGVQLIREDAWFTKVVVSSNAETIRQRILQHFRSPDARIQTMNLREIYLAVAEAKGKSNDPLENMV